MSVLDLISIAAQLRSDTYAYKRRLPYLLYGSMFRIMRTKTSITLPESLLASIDQHAGSFDNNRSAFIEAAVRALITNIERSMQDARDIEIINREADRLNREAEEVLSFQGIP
ncbi:MAG: ribbon-helix-helix domain-containing protein [Terriglobia bacterium]